MSDYERDELVIRLLAEVEALLEEGRYLEIHDRLSRIKALAELRRRVRERPS
jgi:hypothetical protein